MTSIRERSILRLYKAAASYVKHIGGSAIVATGVEIQQFPHEPKYNYRVAIRLTGVVPKLQSVSKGKQRSKRNKPNTREIK